MLPSRSRLRRSEDIGRVRQQGRRRQHPLLNLFIYTQPPECSVASRFAFAVGRHVGKAARRNRLKRRLREIVRRHLGRIEPGYDCLFVARPAAVNAGHDELEGAVVQLLKTSGLLPNDRVIAGGEGSQL